MAGAALAENHVAQSLVPGAQAALSPRHVALLNDSFARVEPASELVATLFFRRLTESEPDIASFLAGDEAEQRRQLISALNLAVASLERFDEIVPALKLLGTRYRQRGVTEYHYGAVGESLLWTLGHSLGSHWTAEVEEAWMALFTLIAETMTREHG